MFFIALFSLGLTSMSTAGPDHEATVECDTPTQFIEITVDPNSENALAFDKTQLNVDKGVCVQLTFINKSTVMAHDVTVEEDAESGFNGFQAHLENSTDGYMGDGTILATFLTPDLDTTLEFYCSIVGHRDGGMFGDVVIGEGAEVPGFEFPVITSALLAFVIIPKIKKRN